MKLVELLEARQTWRPVAGWPAYDVSNTGLVRVRSTGQMLRQEQHYGNDKSQPYRRVMLRDGERRANVRVHRAVALAFIGMPPVGKNEVDHLDGNRSNNAVTNLEWVTSQENITRRTNSAVAKIMGTPERRRSIIDARSAVSAL